MVGSWQPLPEVIHRFTALTASIVQDADRRFGQRARPRLTARSMNPHLLDWVSRSGGWKTTRVPVPGSSVFTFLLEDNANPPPGSYVFTLLLEDDANTRPQSPVFTLLLEDDASPMRGSSVCTLLLEDGENRARTRRGGRSGGAADPQRPTDGSGTATRDRAATSGDITGNDVSPAMEPSVRTKSTAPWISAPSGTSTTTYAGPSEASRFRVDVPCAGTRIVP